MYRVERGKRAPWGKAHPHLYRKMYVLAAHSAVLWKHYAAKTILMAIVSGNKEIEESYTNYQFSSILLSTFEQISAYLATIHSK